MRFAAALLLAGSAAAELRRVHSPSVTPSGWVSTTAAPDRAAVVPVTVGIKRSNVAKLTEKLHAVSDPRSPEYLQHLTWEEVGNLVRPPQVRVDLVLSWLRKNGATDIDLHPHADSVTASFTVAQLEEMMGATFTRFSNSATGQVVDRLASGVWIPEEVAEAVDTFAGFHSFPLAPKRRLSTALNRTLAAGAVNPILINKVHGIPQVKKSGKTNIQAMAQFQGQYVDNNDLDSFCKQFEPNGRSCKVAKYIGKNQQQPGVESMLDSEYMLGLGQGTDTWVFSYPGVDFCGDLLQFGGDVTKNSTFPYSVSVSYGSQKIDFCDSTTINRLSEDIQKMGTVGVSVMLSSGDDGSGHSTRQGVNTGKVSPSFPASIPYVVAVGSTYFVSGTSGEQQATTQFGSGGGFSFDFTVPDYQKSVVKAYQAKTMQPEGGVTYATNGRGTPDVSVLGESFTVLVNGELNAVGGTSASSPSFGAMVSLLNEVCLAEGGKSIGFPLPLFYQNPDVFNDVTKGTSAIAGNAEVGVWRAEVGWDACTGLGWPDFAKLQALVKKHCAAAARK